MKTFNVTIEISRTITAKSLSECKDIVADILDKPAFKMDIVEVKNEEEK